MLSTLASFALACLLAAPASAQDTDATEPATEAAESAPAPVAAATYTIDNSKGLVYVKVLKDETTVMSGMSHNHVMRAANFSGSVTWDPSNPAACKISVSLPVADLDVDPQWLRDQVGYTGKIKDSDRKSIRKNMLDKDQLNGSAHPNITFASTRCTGADGSYKVYGNMSMRGQSAPVSVLMKIDADGSEMSAAGRFSTTHEAFGFEPYSAMMGALKNRSELSFFIHVEGSAQ